MRRKAKSPATTGTKPCSRCRNVLPVSDFTRNACGPMGLQPECRACARVATAARSEWRKAYRENYAKRPETKLLWASRARSVATGEHPRSAEIKRLRAARQARWDKKNAVLRRQKDARRRARRYGASSRTVSRAEWRGILTEFDYCCAYCLQRVADPTVDHFRPLVGGGGHVADNLVPACTSCNRRKSSGLVFDWVRRGIGVTRW